MWGTVFAIGFAIRSGRRAVSARAMLVIMLVAIAWAGQVFAGDIAGRKIIGFSRDGHYFAFTEYGRLARSGFPYASLYVVNTRRNKWVRGSPFRVVLRNEAQTMGAARRLVRQEAARLLRRLKIRHQGRLLASNPLTELSADPHRVAVSMTPPLTGMVRAPGAALVFSLREFPVAAGHCVGKTSAPVKGFAWRVKQAGARAILLHKDRRIPKSRGCPLRYALSDVVGFVKPDGTRLYVVLTSVLRAGSAGLERRFIAGAWHERVYEPVPSATDRDMAQLPDPVDAPDRERRPSRLTRPDDEAGPESDQTELDLRPDRPSDRTADHRRVERQPSPEPLPDASSDDFEDGISERDFDIIE